MGGQRARNYPALSVRRVRCRTGTTALAWSHRADTARPSLAMGHSNSSRSIFVRLGRQPWSALTTTTVQHSRACPWRCVHLRFRGRDLGRVLAVTPGQDLTAKIMGVVMSYVLVPIGSNTRLLLKIVASRGGFGGQLLSIGDLIMARRQLLNLARLAEGGNSPSYGTFRLRIVASNRRPGALARRSVRAVVRLPSERETHGLRRPCYRADGTPRALVFEVDSVASGPSWTSS